MKAKILYGVLGTSANTPKEVLQASLNDTDITDGKYVVPWYGTKKISPSLECVYDWILDNEASFQLVCDTEGRAVPKALMSAADEVVETDDVDACILGVLKNPPIPSNALLMWDDENPDRSLSLATRAIHFGIPSFELTNGLVPIVVDSDTPEDSSIQESPHPELEQDDAPSMTLTLTRTPDPLPVIDPSGFDRETLEIMPAASVKRMAINAGHTGVKSKEEAIDAILGSKPETNSSDIGTILLIFNDGTELGFSLNIELLKEIMNLVVEYQSR